AHFPGDIDRLRRMSLIDESNSRRVRMAHLAIVGSFAVNGVSELHSRLLRERIFRDFAELSPGKFKNQTNGITPRRWLDNCNPSLSRLVTSAIGEGWQTDLDKLRKLAPMVQDPQFCEGFRRAKLVNK